jgi:hypothetical protein
MAEYWTTKDQDRIERYYWAFTGLTSGQTRSTIITEMLPTFEVISRLCLYKVGTPQTPDNIQDCIVKIVCMLPKLQQKKLQATFQFIWTGVTRYLYSKHSSAANKCIYEFSEGIDEIHVLAPITSEADYHQNINDFRNDIMSELDKKIKEQEEIDRTSTKTKFIRLLRQYAIDNDYDMREFNLHAMEKLRISPSLYSLMMKDFGIATKIFNEKKIKEK